MPIHGTKKCDRFLLCSGSQNRKDLSIPIKHIILMSSNLTHRSVHFGHSGRLHGYSYILQNVSDVSGLSVDQCLLLTKYHFYRKQHEPCPLNDVYNWRKLTLRNKIDETKSIFHFGISGICFRSTELCPGSQRARLLMDFSEHESLSSGFVFIKYGI